MYCTVLIWASVPEIKNTKKMFANNFYSIMLPYNYNKLFVTYGVNNILCMYLRYFVKIVSFNFNLFHIS